MSQSTETTSTPKANPVAIAAKAVNYLLQKLPSGTAYCIGIVLTVMMTGRLVESKGSLARAVLPFVFHLKWGWHRVERAMERGKVPLDELFDRALEWCFTNLPEDLPQCQHKRLLVVDAGIATQEQFAASTEQNALVGRLRINCKLRCAPVPKEKGKRGRPAKHGAVLHPGSASPEIEPREDFMDIEGEKKVRVRRWNHLHFEDFADTILDVVRVDHPDYDRPLLIGTVARELTTPELRIAYHHRSPVETNFFVAQDTAAMEMPRAWTENAIKRRISLALLVGFLLKAIAAVCEPIATGPWDRKPQPTAGRLSHYLNVRVNDFSALALKDLKPRNYRKIKNPRNIRELPLPDAA